VTAGMLA